MNRLSYSIVFVSDMPRSTAFYRDVLGLAVKMESPDWTEFDTGETTLALHRTDIPRLQPPVDGTTAGFSHPGIRVDDLDVFHAHSLSLGARCLRPPQPEEFGRLAVYADPDGMAISVVQMKPMG